MLRGTDGEGGVAGLKVGGQLAFVPEQAHADLVEDPGNQNLTGLQEHARRVFSIHVDIHRIFSAASEFPLPAAIRTTIASCLRIVAPAGEAGMCG